MSDVPAGQPIAFPTRPLANPHFHRAVSSPLFSAGQCDRIVEALNPESWTRSTYLNSADDLAASAYHGLGAAGRLARDDGGPRRSLEQGVPLFGRWPLDAIVEAVSIANMAHFRFDLTGIAEFDPPTVVKYSGEDRGHFERHVDIVAPLATRKLSFIVQLSDPSEYVGGRLVFSDIDGTASEERGSMTVFPSFAAHEVVPLVRGERLVVVGWVHGPSFR